MSEDTQETMQFDTAMPGAGVAAANVPPVCERCRNHIEAVYHVVAEYVICGPCRAAVEAAARIPAAVYVRATLGGLAVAIPMGALIKLIAERRSFPISLAVIIAGYVIARAVQWSAGRRRAVGLLLTAMGLTYITLGFGDLSLALDGPVHGVSGILARAAHVLVAPLIVSVASLPGSLAYAVVVLVALTPAWLMLRPPARPVIDGPLVIGNGAASGATADTGARPSGRVYPACGVCGTALSPALDSCPTCGRLVHADLLRTLSAAAREAEARRDWTRALATWRRALDLLPRWSAQHAVISAQVRSSSRRLDTSSEDVGRVAAAASSLRRAAVLLLAGLAKPSTLASLILFLALYWAIAIHGLARMPAMARDRIAPFLEWQFALGFVISIYVHEMGHVSTLLRYGIRASAPIFLPGLGAFVRFHQQPATSREDARIGLSGPLWGLGGALAAYGIFLATRDPVWSALGQTGGFINLLNLLPAWQMDGARVFRALSRRHRWVTVAVATLLCVGSWAAGAQVVGYRLLPGLLLVFAGVAGVQALRTPAPAAPDSQSFTLFTGLIVALSVLAAL